ncbi:MAG: SMI1/KNR4 family protein [Planctomycetes bacterium]|nr:SMI1/KNR4 family protein [Planctomycetota bacterium]
MDPAGIIAGWKQRLINLADHPGYVYVSTPRRLIKQEYRRLTTFVGYPESEVAAAESRLGVRFPAVFRQYLLEMGQSPGELFDGSETAGPAGFDQLRADALELMAETDPALTLPPEAIVFLFHQGYMFLYLLAASGFDGPVMSWTETEREPRQVAAGFAEMVDADLRLMEDNNRQDHEDGGYYQILGTDGGGTQVHPPLARAERPLDYAWLWRLVGIWPTVVDVAARVRRRLTGE